MKKFGCDDLFLTTNHISLLKSFKLIVTGFCLLGICASAMAQAKNDYNWILGYPPNRPDIFYGGVRINFDNNLAPPEFFNTDCWALFPATLS